MERLDAKRLRTFEDETGNLKKLVAEQVSGTAMLRDSILKMQYRLLDSENLSRM